MVPGYAELYCQSNFTFLEGASHPEELVERAAELGYAALAITDECSVAGVVRAHLATRGLASSGLKLIVGTLIHLQDGPSLVLLACSRHGYGNLASLISQGRRAAPKGNYCLHRADLHQGLDDCLALWLPGPDSESCAMQGKWLKKCFPGRSWLAVTLPHGPDDARRMARLLELGTRLDIPPVAAGNVLMHDPDRRALQDTLTAIRLRTTLREAGYALHPNGERYLRPLPDLTQRYPPGLLAQTLEIADRCQFLLDELRYEYPDEIVPAGETPASWLRRCVEDGFGRLHGAALPTADIRHQIEHELALIGEMRYEPYFLTVYDLVCFAREHGILCQGRGSAANSAVCYYLGITAVPPVEGRLLFERFISKERGEPPDIDVDFEHERREEVIQYIYRKYGRERSALAAALITYRPRSALKDVGRALGLEMGCLNHLTRNMAWWDRRENMAERLQEAGLDPGAPVVQRMLQLVHQLLGFPRHLSQHTGGFVISRGPISHLVPIENAAMSGRTVIQWDKDDLDALGLLKVDVLALGMLSAIRRCLAMVNGWNTRFPKLAAAPPLTLGTIPGDDREVYAMLSQGDSVGVFQVESRAQMSMLPRLKPSCFYDLVVEVAIVRPGPIQGGMVHPYLRRKQGLDPVRYPSEAVQSVLERTLGVPIFQEQVMQLAMVAAGFTAGEADELRRSMAAWRRKGGLSRFEHKLKKGMTDRGYDQEFADAIYRQICGFGEYGFPESHAASFAILVYVSAWLKCHYPAAFLCALLNSQPMGFYAPSQLIQDARRHGVSVLPVDVTASQWESELEALHGESATPGARLGLCLVQGLDHAAVERLIQARQEQAFRCTEDLARRAKLGPQALGRLAAAGALGSLAGNRRRAHWQAAGSGYQPGLLADGGPREPCVDFPSPSVKDDVLADYGSLGFTLGAHPLALLRHQLQSMRLIPAAAIADSQDRCLARTAGLVTCRQRPGTATGVVFVTLEDETGVSNVIVHHTLVERQRRELLNARLLGVYGQIQRAGPVVHLVAMRLIDYSALLGGLATRSRDFH